MALALAPLLAFGLVEGALRLSGFGYNTEFFRTVRREGQDWLVNNDDFVLRFFPPEKARLPRPFMIEARKPPGVHRIFVFGESAAEGDPDPAYGPVRFMEILLRERFPGQRFQIVNAAVTANNSHGILPIARECARREGDLWIIYMGNNEMVGPFGAATVFGQQAPPLWLARLNLALQRTRVGQGLRGMAAHLSRGPSSSTWGGLEMFARNQLAPDDPRKTVVYRNFHRNLNDILRVGIRAGTKIVLNTVAVNLRDCPPLATWPATNLPAMQRPKFEELVDQANREQESGEFARSVEMLSQAARLDARNAAIQYRWGECLLALTNYAAAREHFQAACDNDALPVRADGHINGIIREAARQFAGTNLVLLEAPTILGGAGVGEVCGAETFYEHVHFNYSGSYRLGRAWAEQVEQTLGIQAQAAAPWASPEICEQRLALTDWNRRNDFSEIVARRSAPPLNGLSNNSRQLAVLQQQLAELNRRMDAADAAQSKTLCLEAIARAPRDADLRCNYADMLEALAEPGPAAEQWQEVQRLLPLYYMGYFQEGRMRERLGELDAARGAFEQAVALRPAMASAWFELSNVDASQGKLDAALRELDRARQEQPHQPAYYACLGRLLSRMQRHDEAVRRYRQALALDPTYWDGRLALGEELAAANELAAAQTEFESCLRVRTNSVRAHLDLGDTLARQGQVEAAKRELESCLRLEPANHQAQAYLDRLRSH